MYATSFHTISRSIHVGTVVRECARDLEDLPVESVER